MPPTPNLNFTLQIFAVLIVLLPIQTYAFGAGDIPDFSYLNDKAFRHGDIENILETLVKSAGGAAAGGGLLGFAKSVISSASGGPKFSRSDIKKVYFGNWLRDYSQAMDIAGLSKLTADTLVLVVSILGFMTFGFATEEFQVTADRLGVYLPVEHIDNPKGYAAKEGDARRFHPKLRPPVDNRELEIDQRTGMKNYMATERQGWDTSTAFIRRTLTACIQAGRNSGGRNSPELYEAYRLLGTGLHTLEDLLAHSNWCEIALRKLGHREVFCHVGDNVLVDTPNGRAPPLVTGTFGGADFIYSLMGEATDHLSQASVTDLSQKMDQASQGDSNAFDKLKAILGKLPIGGNDDAINNGQEMQAQSKAYHFDPNNIAPPEVQRQLFGLLKWRDNVYRNVVAKIEMVPGLDDLLEELTNALNAYVYTILAPYITPILQQATGVLGEGSKSVIESGDQFEVFDNPNASDPTHSVLSKDHFDLILNEPAGKIAQIVVEHAVNNIVRAWSDDSDPNRVIDVILEAFHHPHYATGQSNIQNQMFEYMGRWIGGMGRQQKEAIIQRLTKDSVRNGKNKREESESGSHNETGYGVSAQKSNSGNQTQQGYSGRNQTQQGDGGSYRTQQSYGGGNQTQQGYGGGNQTQQGYGGGNQIQQGYGGGNQTHQGTQQGYGGVYKTQQGGIGGYKTQQGDAGGYQTQQGYDGGSKTQQGYGGGYQSQQELGGKYRGQQSHDEYQSGGQSQHGYGGNQSEQAYGGSGYESSPRRNDNPYSGNQEYSATTTHGRNARERESDAGRFDDERGSGRTREPGGHGSSRFNKEYERETPNSYESSRTEDQYGRGEDKSSRRRREDSTPYSGRDESYGKPYGSSQNQSGESQRVSGQSQHHERTSRRQDDSDSYGTQREERSGYLPSYTQASSRDEYGSSQYGGGRGTEESYKSSSDRYRGGGQQSYSRYGGDEETFGAERLSLGDNDDGEENRRHERHQRQHHGHGSNLEGSYE